MAREKKITVKTLLNQGIKGKIVSFPGGKMYPLYVEVTYDRKYTKFPFGNQWYPLSAAKTIEENENVKGALRGVEKVVRYELERDPNFTVKGFGTRFKTFMSPFQTSFYALFYHWFNKYLPELMTKENYELWKDRILHDDENDMTTALKAILEDGKLPKKWEILFKSSAVITEIWENQNILTWLIYTDQKEKLSLVSNYLEKNEIVQIINTWGDYFKLDFKKDTPEILIKHIDKFAHEMIDNQIVTWPEVEEIKFNIE